MKQLQGHILVFFLQIGGATIKCTKHIFYKQGIKLQDLIKSTKNSLSFYEHFY